MHAYIYRYRYIWMIPFMVSFCLGNCNNPLHHSEATRHICTCKETFSTRKHFLTQSTTKKQKGGGKKIVLTSNPSIGPNVNIIWQKLLKNIPQNSLRKRKYN